MSMPPGDSPVTRAVLDAVSAAIVSDEVSEDVTHNNVDNSAATNSIPNRPVENMTDEEKEHFHPSNVLPEQNCTAFFRTDEPLETREICQALQRDGFPLRQVHCIQRKRANRGNSYHLQHAATMQDIFEVYYF